MTPAAIMTQMNTRIERELKQRGDAVLARAGFGLLYMGGNILCQRVLGGLASRALSFVFYFMILMVLLLPSVFVGFGLGFLLGIPVGLLGAAGCNILLTALLLWLCRNMLDCAELNQ